MWIQIANTYNFPSAWGTYFNIYCSVSLPVKHFFSSRMYIKILLSLLLENSFFFLGFVYIFERGGGRERHIDRLHFAGPQLRV